MAKPKPRIPFARFRAIEPLTLSEDQWQKIEKAYGRKLDQQFRQRVEEETHEFLTWAQSDLEPGSMQDAIRHVETMRKGARVILDELGNKAVADSIREYAKLQICMFSQGHSPGAPGAQRAFVDSFAASVRAFDLACELTLQDLARDTNLNSWRKGWAWDVWINRLTQIAREHGLPDAAPTDTDKRKPDRASPFVAFVHRLQTCIPAHQRARAESALAVAISRARREPKIRHQLRQPPKRRPIKRRPIKRRFK